MLAHRFEQFADLAHTVGADSLDALNMQIDLLKGKLAQMQDEYNTLYESKNYLEREQSDILSDLEKQRKISTAAIQDRDKVIADLQTASVEINQLYALRDDLTAQLKDCQASTTTTTLLPKSTKTKLTT